MNIFLAGSIVAANDSASFDVTTPKRAVGAYAVIQCSLSRASRRSQAAKDGTASVMACMRRSARWRLVWMAAAYIRELASCNDLSPITLAAFAFRAFKWSKKQIIVATECATYQVWHIAEKYRFAFVHLSNCWHAFVTITDYACGELWVGRLSRTHPPSLVSAVTVGEQT